MDVDMGEAAEGIMELVDNIKTQIGDFEPNKMTLMALSAMVSAVTEQWDTCCDENQRLTIGSGIEAMVRGLKVSEEGRRSYEAAIAPLVNGGREAPAPPAEQDVSSLDIGLLSDYYHNLLGCIEAWAGIAPIRAMFEKVSALLGNKAIKRYGNSIFKNDVNTVEFGMMFLRCRNLAIYATDYLRDSEAMEASVPMYLFRYHGGPRGPKLMSEDEMKAALVALRQEIVDFREKAVIASRMAYLCISGLRECIKRVCPSFVSGEEGCASWRCTTKEQCEAIIDGFYALFDEGNAASTLSKFKPGKATMQTHKYFDRLKAPFNTHGLMKGERSAKELIQLICIYADTTLFKAHTPTDENLHFMNFQSSVESKSTERQVRSLLTHEEAGLFTSRQDCSRGEYSVLSDADKFILAIDEALRGRGSGPFVKVDDVNNPFFWTKENFMMHEFCFDRPDTISIADYVMRTPQYHSLHTSLARNGAERLTLFGSEGMERRALPYVYVARSHPNRRMEVERDRDVRFCPETLRSVRSPADTIERAMWRPETFTLQICDQRQTDGFMQEPWHRRWPGGAAEHIFDTLHQQRSVGLRYPVDQTPCSPGFYQKFYELYMSNVLRCDQGSQKPFMPFSDGEFNPDIASDVTIDNAGNARTVLEEEGISIYCFRAWYQMYCMLNGLMLVDAHERAYMPFEPTINKEKEVVFEPIVQSVPMTGRRLIRVKFNDREGLRAACRKSDIMRDARVVGELSRVPDLKSIAFDSIQIDLDSNSITYIVPLDDPEPEGSTATGRIASWEVLKDHTNRRVLRMADTSGRVLRVVISAPRALSCIMFDQVSSIWVDKVGHDELPARLYVFDRRSSNGYSSLFDFAFVYTMLNMWPGIIGDMTTRACPEGMASLSPEERRFPVPRPKDACDVGPASPLYDMPWRHFCLGGGGDRHNLVALDLTDPKMYRLAKSAHVLASCMLRSSTVKSTRQNEHVFGSTSSCSERGYINTNILDCGLPHNEQCRQKKTFLKSNLMLTFNRVCAGNQTLTCDIGLSTQMTSRSGNANKEMSVSMMPSENEGGGPSSSRAREGGGRASRSDQLYSLVSCPFLGIAPLAARSALYSGNCPNPNRLTRFFSSYAINDSTHIAGDRIETDSPVLVDGEAQYARLYSNPHLLMRYKYDNSQATFVEVSSIDARLSHERIASFDRRAPADPTACSEKRFPFLLTPADGICLDTSYKYIICSMEVWSLHVGSLAKLRPWIGDIIKISGARPGEVHEWVVASRPGQARPLDDNDTLVAITVNIQRLLNAASEMQSAFVVEAVTYLGRYCFYTTQEYDVAMRRYVIDSDIVGSRASSLITSASMDEVYVDKAMADASDTIEFYVSKLFETVTQALANDGSEVTRQLDCDASILCSKQNIDDIVAMCVSFPRVVSFLYSVMRLQLCSNMIRCPEYVYQRVTSNVHNRSTEEAIMIEQIQNLGYITVVGEDRPYIMHGSRCMFYQSILNEACIGVEFQRVLRSVMSAMMLRPPMYIKAKPPEPTKKRCRTGTTKTGTLSEKRRKLVAQSAVGQLAGKPTPLIGRTELVDQYVLVDERGMRFWSCLSSRGSVFDQCALEFLTDENVNALRERMRLETSGGIAQGPGNTWTSVSGAFHHPIFACLPAGGDPPAGLTCKCTIRDLTAHRIEMEAPIVTFSSMSDAYQCAKFADERLSDAIYTIRAVAPASGNLLDSIDIARLQSCDFTMELSMRLDGEPLHVFSAAFAAREPPVSHGEYTFHTAPATCADKTIEQPQPPTYAVIICKQDAVVQVQLQSITCFKAIRS